MRRKHSIEENCGRELRAMRDYFQETLVLELEGMLKGKLVVLRHKRRRRRRYDLFKKCVLGSAIEDVSGQRILGTLWNYYNNNLVFDFTNTASLAKRVEPTKRNVISTISKMYDPLGMIAPITEAHNCTLGPINRTIEC